MTGFENRKGQDLQKPFPGCVGKMINIFDLSSGMPRTKLVTDKPHRDDSPTNKNRSDMEKKRQIDIVRVEDNQASNDRWKGSSKKSGGTPMRMLIAQELLREKEPRQKPTNVVARLMGLDALPVQQSELTRKRSLQEGYSRNFSSGNYHRQLEGDSGHRPLQFDTPSSNHEKRYKDVYEVRQHPARVCRLKDRTQRKGRFDENATEKRMELVRQKFNEAKRLATDERLFQSREFQDAREVLSSNRDLFLKFLEEPNCLVSKDFHRIQHVPSSQINRITVLKPSNTTETKDEVQAIKDLYPAVGNINRNMNMNQRNSRGTIFIHHKAENSQTTRIVVLKPSSGTPNETKTASPITPLKQLEDRDFNGILGTDEAIELREVAKKITRQMQQYLSSERRDEALLSSSALSNGYVGDESSFNRSENDFNGERCCYISDSEAATPTSRHSWDYNNRFGSPCSISSFSHASCFPEPSVIREAKKRLSERWAVMASNGSYQEQNQMQRSSSTLGDMLAIPEAKKEEGSDDLTISRSCSYDEEQEIKASAGCFPTSGVKVGCGEDSARNLLRSKSLPVSSSVYENVELKVVPDPLTSKTIDPKELPKLKTGVSSFKGKVSSFFFPRSKKSGREKDIPPASDGHDNRLRANSAEASCKRNDGSSESFHNSNSEDGMLTNSEEKCRGYSSSPNSMNGHKHANPSAKQASRSLENQDQPSPISVLEAQFEDDANIISQSSLRAISGHPQTLSRSPLIESVSRTLTWDSPHLGRPLLNSSKLSRVLSKEREEQERFSFVQKLLSSACLVDSGDCTVLARWHSLDSPLDPMLLDEFLDRKEEAAKCRERRSNQRLLFDCVNAALLDIGWSTLIVSYPYARACGQTWKESKKCTLVAEEVWRLARDWFSSEDNQESGENEDSVVEELVKREVAGSGWSESMCSEIDEFSKEIGGELLEELVKEVFADLSDVCL